MTVHVLMPVFNRLAMTQSMLECLRAQQIDEPLSLIVIDDGSTDGTGEFLRAQADVATLQGDGSLWWGGAIDLGLQYVLQVAAAEDWVLFVNNDTRIDSDFIQALLGIARRYAPAAVGSAIRDLLPPHQLLSIGPRVESWYLRVRDVFDTSGQGGGAEHEVMPMNALSGRGVLYPVAAIRAVGGMRPRCLPHYLADYELAVRVRAAGWTLLVSPSVSVQSREDYGNAYRGASLRERLFSVRSPTYLPALIRFWWVAGNGWEKFTLPWRMLIFALFPRLRKKS